MKKNDDIRDLYRRFSKEMDQLPLPSVEELIKDNGKAVSTSQNNGRVIPLHGSRAKRRWIFAAAAILAAIFCISMLFRINGLSGNDNNTIIATNVPNEETNPKTLTDSLSTETNHITTPTFKENKDIEQLYAKTEPNIIATDSIHADTTKTPGIDSPTPLLANTPSTTEPNAPQIADATPFPDSTLAAKTATAADSTKADSTDTANPQKQNMNIDESQRAIKEKDCRRALKEKKRQREKARETKTILEEKKKGEQNDLYMVSPSERIMIYHSN